MNGVLEVELTRYHGFIANFTGQHKRKFQFDGRNGEKTSFYRSKSSIYRPKQEKISNLSVKSKIYRNLPVKSKIYRNLPVKSKIYRTLPVKKREKLLFTGRKRKLLHRSDKRDSAEAYSVKKPGKTRAHPFLTGRKPLNAYRDINWAVNRGTLEGKGAHFYG